MSFQVYASDFGAWLLADFDEHRAHVRRSRQDDRAFIEKLRLSGRIGTVKRVAEESALAAGRRQGDGNAALECCGGRFLCGRRWRDRRLARERVELDGVEPCAVEARVAESLPSAIAGLHPALESKPDRVRAVWDGDFMEGPGVCRRVVRVNQYRRVVHQHGEGCAFLARLISETHVSRPRHGRLDPRFIAIKGSVVRGTQGINAVVGVGSLECPRVRVGRAPFELGRIHASTEVSDGIGGLENGADAVVRDGGGADGRRMCELDGAGVEHRGDRGHGAVDGVTDGEPRLAGRKRDVERVREGRVVFRREEDIVRHRHSLLSPPGGRQVGLSDGEHVVMRRIAHGRAHVGDVGRRKEWRADVVVAVTVRVVGHDRVVCDVVGAGEVVAGRVVVELRTRFKVVMHGGSMSSADVVGDLVRHGVAVGDCTDRADVVCRFRER